MYPGGSLCKSVGKIFVFVFPLSAVILSVSNLYGPKFYACSYDPYDEEDVFCMFGIIVPERVFKP